MKHSRGLRSPCAVILLSYARVVQLLHSCGHFSKLFEFAGRNRLKTPIFVPKSGCSLKKKRSSLGIDL